MTHDLVADRGLFCDDHVGTRACVLHTTCVLATDHTLLGRAVGSRVNICFLLCLLSFDGGVAWLVVTHVLLCSIHGCYITGVVQCITPLTRV
jgi:hypothetical protein